MDNGGGACNSRQSAHKRQIVRSFAPHLSNPALARQERFYFALGLAHVLLVFVLPACAVFYARDWAIRAVSAVVAMVVTAVELFVALHRYCVLWPEGRKRRWEYWHEIELADDDYKLKIMGYYHRKITKYTGTFPVSMTSSEIQQYYVTRGVVLWLLFMVAYVASLLLLVHANDASILRTWVLYLLAVGSGLVVVRFAKLHLIELPQVLALRQHPDFAGHLLTGGSHEAIPFARPVATYSSDERRTPDSVSVDIRKAGA